MDFDQPLDRRASDSLKWNLYDKEVLPLWVADMDFASAPAIQKALVERVQHGVFGYGGHHPRLLELLVGRMRERYQWTVAESDIVLLPGMTPGLSLACLSEAQPGEGVVVPNPVYAPIHRSPDLTSRRRINLEFVRNNHRWEFAPEALSLALQGAKLFHFCNPHNPTGRVFSRAELTLIAQTCLEHNVVICSDEIHCDLVFKPHTHIPIASLDPEVANQSITLMAPSKTFNLPGLSCAFAIIPNAERRRRFIQAAMRLVPEVSLMGIVGASAAYEYAQEWLTDALAYLDQNRQLVHAYVRDQLPGVTADLPEGTYLTWLDCSASAVASKDPYTFFLEKAKVAMNPGPWFGSAGAGYVRINYACRRSVLVEALDRIKAALLA